MRLPAVALRALAWKLWFVLPCSGVPVQNGWGVHGCELVNFVLMCAPLNCASVLHCESHPRCQDLKSSEFVVFSSFFVSTVNGYSL